MLALGLRGSAPARVSGLLPAATHPAEPRTRDGCGRRSGGEAAGGTQVCRGRRSRGPPVSWEGGEGSGGRLGACSEPQQRLTRSVLRERPGRRVLEPGRPPWPGALSAHRTVRKGGKTARERTAAGAAILKKLRCPAKGSGLSGVLGTSRDLIQVGLSPHPASWPKCFSMFILYSPAFVPSGVVVTHRLLLSVGLIGNLYHW